MGVERAKRELDGYGPPLLSICIPTYDRGARISRLVSDLVRCPGPFELCVHVDGSSDGTVEMLGKIEDRRLRVTTGTNRGRAGALAAAVANATGAFTMLFDDDDDLWADGVARVLADCSMPLPDGAAGFIYHLADETGGRLGSGFPRGISNFLELRHDLGVRGDKKEVVRTDLLKPIVAATAGMGRRVPTSLYWSTIALDHDVVCRDFEIGRKAYQPGGMSDRIRRLKHQSPRPLAELYKVQLKGFAKGRFRSPRAAFRAVAGLAYYGLNALLRARPGSR